MVFEEDKFLPNIQLPVRQFMYTVDQIAHMLNCSADTLYKKYIWYTGRDHGRPGSKLQAINIAPLEDGTTADWRIPEENFVFWCRQRGIAFHEQRIPLKRRPNHKRPDS
jgi:hypothetical protein